jgi:PPK2 family polyphosphate:nucleotide phosphotransferase
MLPARIVDRFKVKDGNKFRLADFDPADTFGLNIEKDEAKDLLASGVKRLRELQERLYAEGRWSILVVLQAMDAAGKDSAIEHVMSGINPQCCEVRSFKAPEPTELKHDYLWRTTVALPERGRVGIFNRSYYEEVLVVRVHPEALANEKLPPDLVTKDIWKERFEDIRSFERHIHRNGTVLLKFYLHISKDEQKRRFLRRIDDPTKRWKFSIADVAKRGFWDDYMVAYEDMIHHTATADCPWYVVPADNKWFSRLVIAAAIVEALKKLDPQFPTVDDAALKTLESARAALIDEDSKKMQ